MFNNHFQLAAFLCPWSKGKILQMKGEEGTKAGSLISSQPGQLCAVRQDLAASGLSQLTPEM